MFKKPKASRQIRRRDDDDEGARGASDDVDAATTATTTTATTTTTTTADLSAHDARALLRHRHRRTHGLDADELSKASVLATAAQLTGRSAAGMNTKRKRRGLTGEQLSDGDDDDGANDDPWKLTSGGGLVDLKKIKAGGGGGPGGSNVDMGGVNVARKSMFQGSASATGGAQDVEKHMHRYIEDKLRAKLLETQKKRASAESGGNADDGDVDANGDAEVNAAAMLGEVKLLQAVQETLDSESAADGSRRTIVVDKDQLLHELPKELTEEASELLVAKRNESEIQVTVSMGQLMNVPEVARRVKTSCAFGCSRNDHAAYLLYR